MMKRSLNSALIRWKEKEQRKPLLLEGARQVGKTWLLKEFSRTHFQQSVYIDFSEHPEYSDLFEKNLDPKRIISEMELIFDMTIDLEKTLIVFDEVQLCPKAITSLKYFFEAFPKAFICASGSLLGIGLSTGNFPVGKVQREVLFPMTFFEFLDALGEQRLIQFLMAIEIKDGQEELPALIHDRVLENYKLYLVTGGLPEVVDTFVQQHSSLKQAFQSIRALQKSLIQSYMDDIAKHSGNLKAIRISSLLKNIPEQLARETQGKKFVFKGVLPKHSNYNTLEGPMEWLNKAGLIHRVPICQKARLPLMSYTKENTFILYLFDVGLLGAMLDISPVTLYKYDFGQQKGFFAENFVLQELMAHLGQPIYSWNENTAEIEFLITGEDGPLPIEVKAGLNTKAKSLKVFKGKYGPSRSILYSTRSIISSHQGDLHLPIYLCSQTSRYQSFG
jgi:predicted AAA+ superfamily ATPase